MAVDVCFLSLSSLIPMSLKFQRGIEKRMDDALEPYRALFDTHEEVVGHGLGGDVGRYVVKVYVRSMQAALKKRIREIVPSLLTLSVKDVGHVILPVELEEQGEFSLE